MLDIRRRRLLRELSRRGTIAAVGDALGFSPSAVSQQLAVLEREAGVPLLERTGRRVALTPAGSALVTHAEAVLERLERAGAELAQARRGLAGPLRIGTFPSAARAIVPAALAVLARAHPGLEPMVAEVDPAEVADALRAGELDAVLVHVYDFVPTPPDPGVAAEPLFEEPLYLASPKSPTDAGGTANPADPAPTENEGAAAGEDPIGRRRHAPWILAAPGTLCHTMAVRACQAAGFAPRVRHHIDDFGTVPALVAVGQGVALVPRLGTVDPPPGVVLTRLPMFRRTSIAFRRGAGAHPAVTALTEALRDVLPADLRTPNPRDRPRPSTITQSEYLDT